ncbi:MAG: DUF3379 family protein [Gammaproteobacteria bacterium]|nr:DUF3379 family protein [Gammaproteobacteria bacterium]
MNTSIDCLEMRRILGAEPQRRDPVLLEHCKVCAACSAFMREMLGLDARLTSALSIDVPEGLEARIVFRTTFRVERRHTYSWLVAAASVILAVGIGFGVWQYQQNSMAALSTALVAHVTNPEEAEALDPNRPLLQDASFVHGVLDRVGVRMQGSMDDITYAHVCPFRGELVAHLVVRGKDGPVTVLLLPHVHVNKPRHFDEHGYRGEIVPAGTGSIAILANNPSPMQPIEQQFVSMVQWSI